jgi:uncharacterized protein YgiM (DUF1202 family)
MSDEKSAQWYKVHASDGLNLRSQPTLKSRIVAVIDDSSMVTRVDETVQEADGYQWYNIGYEGRTGWAVSDFLELKKAAQAEPISALKAMDTIHVTNASYRNQSFADAYLNSIPPKVVGGDVKYTDEDSQGRQTDLGNWNVVVADVKYKFKP